MTLSAGTLSSPTRSQAIVTVVTGTAGGIAGALNFAVAINAAQNKASLIGNATGTLTGSSLNISADGVTRVYAIIANASVAGLSVNISVAIALLKSVQEAAVSSAAAIALTGSMKVTSRQNTAQQSYSSFLLQITDRLTDTISGRFSTMAQAYIFSASAASCRCKPTWRRHGGRDRARKGERVESRRAGRAEHLQLRRFDRRREGGQHYICVRFRGSHDGYAYAAGTFEALLSGAGAVTAGSLTILQQLYGGRSSDLTPAAAGLQAGAYDLGVNVSIAQSKTIAKAYIAASHRHVTGAVIVASNGAATANAIVRGAAISISGVKVALNSSTATVSVAQDAYITGVSVGAASVDVNTTLNDSERTGAVASVGSTGANPACRLRLSPARKALRRHWCPRIPTRISPARRGRYRSRFGDHERAFLRKRGYS
jgi:hypothetical protein